MCGLIPETVDVTSVTPLDVVNFTCFYPPVLLRTSEKVLPFEIYLVFFFIQRECTSSFSSVFNVESSF